MGVFFLPKKNSFVRGARITRLRLERLEDRTVPTTFVVGTGGNAALQHFNTFSGALATAQAGDTIQISQAGVQTDTLDVNSILGGTTNVMNGATTITTNNNFVAGSIITITQGANSMRTVVDAATPAGGGQFTLTLHDAVFNAPAAGFAPFVTTVDSTGTLAIDKANLAVIGLPTTSAFADLASVEVWLGTNGVTFQNLSSNVSIEDPTAFVTSDPQNVAVASSTSVIHDSLGSITIPTQSGKNVINSSTLGGLTVTGGGVATANGNNSITFNSFNGDVDLTGNTPGTPTNDVFSNNVLTDSSLTVTNDDGATVNSNTLTETSTTTALTVTNSQNITVSGNYILFSGANSLGAVGIAVTQTNPPAPTATVSGTLDANQISTFTGHGISLSMFDGTKFTLTVSNNDLRNNVVGVSIAGDGTAATTAAGTVTVSGNNFTGFSTAAAAANTKASIVLSNATNGTVAATGNIFNDATPQSTVRDGMNNTAAAGNFPAATGTVSTGTALNANSAYIQSLYLQFLGRSAAANEVAYWANILSASGQNAVATGISHSQAYYTRLVTTFYNKLLNRSPDAAGLTYWVNQLVGGATEESVLAGFLSSTEFFNFDANGGGGNPNINWINQLYTTLLGRGATGTDLNYWQNTIGTAGLLGAATLFVNSAEFRGDQVLQYYQVNVPLSLFAPPMNLLNRITPPTGAEVNFWVGSTSDLLGIQAGITASPEFFNNG